MSNYTLLTIPGRILRPVSQNAFSFGLLRAEEVADLAEKVRLARCDVAEEPELADASSRAGS
jgi:hypothetical protein